MIELKLATVSPYGMGMSACLAVLNRSWCNNQFDLRVSVEYGFREVLTIAREGEEYELNIEWRTAPEIVDWVTAMLEVIRDD